MGFKKYEVVLPIVENGFYYTQVNTFLKFYLKLNEWQDIQKCYKIILFVYLKFASSKCYAALNL